MDMDQKLKKIGQAFRIEGDYLGYEQIKVGNVNQTYKVTYRQPDGSPKNYIVQRVNTYAFRQPEELMHNADLITEHIRAKKQAGVALHFHHTHDRKTFVYDEEHGFWRLTNYIPSVTYSGSTDPEILRRTGEAFGAFQRQLSDFPAADLYETIPNFHNTPKRLETLFADAERDPVGRVAEVREELAYIASVREEAETLTRLYEAGKLPLRVTHNDTKINNVLFNRETDEAMVIIDLDTVMPGLVGYDFGDGVRFAANCVAEDCPEAAQAKCDLARFQAFAGGFLSQTADMLTETERKTLALSVFSITVELAARFLDDYIVGDQYFNIEYPTHNLIRARCQLALAKDVHEKLAQMQAYIDTFA